MLSVSFGFGGVLFVMFGIFIAFAGHEFRIELFGTAFSLFALAVLYHVVWDIGARLHRLEYRMHMEKIAFEEDK